VQVIVICSKQHAAGLLVLRPAHGTALLGYPLFLFVFLEGLRLACRLAYLESVHAVFIVVVVRLGHHELLFLLGPIVRLDLAVTLFLRRIRYDLFLLRSSFLLVHLLGLLLRELKVVPVISVLRSKLRRLIFVLWNVHHMRCVVRTQVAHE